MGAPDLSLERAMVEADEAFTASAVRRVFGVEPQPDPLGLLGNAPGPMSVSGEADEDAQFDAYMRRCFPGSTPA